jgi:hypothetical protein
MPPGLDETYDNILRNISEDDRERVRRALYWIINADRPLSLDELAEAIAIDPSQVEFDKSMRLFVVEDLLEMCGSLVQLDSTKESVGLAHYSVQEYLLSPRLASKDMPISYFAVDRSKHLITSSLLTYNFIIALEIARTSAPDSMISLRGRFPLVEYIHRSWFNTGLEDYTTVHNWFEQFFSTRNPRQATSRLEEVWFKNCTDLKSQDEKYITLISGIAEVLRKNLLSFLDQALDPRIPDDRQRGDHIHDTLEIIRKSQDRWEEMGEEQLRQLGHGWNWQYSPLQAAATFGYDRIVRFLLSNSACVNGVQRFDDDRVTDLLYYAVWGNQEVVVRTLVEHGADPNYRSAGTLHFTTPKNILALALTRSPGLFNVLLDSGADPNEYDSIGYNFHHWKLHDSKTILHLRGISNAAAKLGGTGCGLPNLSLRQRNVFKALQLFKSGLETSPDLQLFKRRNGWKWLPEALLHDGLDEYAAIFMEQWILQRQDGTLEHSVFCDECAGYDVSVSNNFWIPLTGPRYKCLDCMDVDLCAPCYERMMSGELDLRCDFLQICRGHKWLKVPRDCWYAFPEGVVTERGQSLMDVVDELLVRYSAVARDKDEDEGDEGAVRDWEEHAPGGGEGHDISKDESEKKDLGKAQMKIRKIYRTPCPLIPRTGFHGHDF